MTPARWSLRFFPGQNVETPGATTGDVTEAFMRSIILGRQMRSMSKLSNTCCRALARI